MMYKVGQKVRLIKDEGLDTPGEYQGQLGTVIAMHPNDPTNANPIMLLDLQMADDQVIEVTDYQVVGTNMMDPEYS